MKELQAVNVSVVIPCYNLGKYIDEAVESVLHQTYKDFEIIVVNDGSTDEYTNSLLFHYDKPKTRVITTKNQGPAAARNTAISESRGDYILPLDADDKIELTYLEKAVKILNNDPHIGFVYSLVRIYGEKEGTWETRPFDIRELLAENCVPICSLFRKKAWEEVGGYKRTDPDGAEDWDFWLNIAKRGWKGYRLPEYLFLYRWRHDSICRICDLPENYIKLVSQICSNHKEFYQKYVDYVICWKEKLILDKNREVLDRDKVIVDQKMMIQNLQDRLQTIEKSRIYKFYKKIEYYMGKNRFTLFLFKFFKNFILIGNRTLKYIITSLVTILYLINI